MTALSFPPGLPRTSGAAANLLFGDRPQKPVTHTTRHLGAPTGPEKGYQDEGSSNTSGTLSRTPANPDASEPTPPAGGPFYRETGIKRVTTTTEEQWDIYDGRPAAPQEKRKGCITPKRLAVALACTVIAGYLALKAIFAPEPVICDGPNRNAICEPGLSNDFGGPDWKP
jgi:hypothetical protein